MSLIYYALGYHNLYKEGILHRDISVNNILIGKPGVLSQNRGIIVDLDMAIKSDRTNSDVMTVSCILSAIFLRRRFF